MSGYVAHRLDGCGIVHSTVAAPNEQALASAVGHPVAVLALAFRGQRKSARAEARRVLVIHQKQCAPRAARGRYQEASYQTRV